jgi:ribonuclease P/MRP protein subunit POP1
MISKWGLRLARTPCDKSVRASHRAVNHACTLHDASHAGVIEVAGTREDVLRALARLITPALEPAETTGEVELSRLLHYSSGEDVDAGASSSARGSGPSTGSDEGGGALVCPVTMLWRQGQESDDDTSSSGSGGGGGNSNSSSSRERATREPLPHDNVVVWVYTPAAAYTEALELLTSHAAEVDNATVDVAGRRGELLRFELVGPEATAVLSRALSPEARGPAGHEQVELWEAVAALNAAGSIRRRAVLALTVLDPRLASNAQGRRRDESPHGEAAVARDAATTRAALQRRCVAAMAKWPAGVARSSIWSADVRREVKDSLVPVKALNERRSAMGIPGVALPPQPSDARVPVLLVQRPGAPAPATGHGRQAGGRGSARGKSSGGGGGGRRGCQAGYGGGWDVIVPAGWGMAFWLPLVFAGGRAIGLKERKSVALEKGVPHFPEDFPDTAR